MSKKPVIVKCSKGCGVKILTEEEYNTFTYKCSFCKEKMTKR